VTTYARDRPENIASIFIALGDPTRREIFERVATRPQSVSELAGDLPVSRPAVSQHLKVLLTAGLVTQQAAGTRRVYRIDADGVGEVRAYFDRFWAQALEAFRIAAEAPPSPPAPDPSFDQGTEEQS
jgi:DNA-binding transcriptional ArsR family regulator